jgi:hypothetical protein
MEITDKCITHKNIKGLISMSSTSKTQDWGNNYSEMRRVLQGFKTEELETLSDAYAVMGATLFKMQIKAIKDELELRKTSLGKELM